MISISKLLFEQDLKPTTKNINKSPALNQGKKFNNYQNKIQNSLEKKAINLSEKEDFNSKIIQAINTAEQNEKDKLKIPVDVLKMTLTS